jgi:16S rRNA (guanine527-N7)-methyltransferase
VSGIRTEPTSGNEAREGPGKPGREPDEPRKTEGRGRCDVRRRREWSPDGPHRHDRQEGCLDRPRDPLPTSVEACPPLPIAYHDALDTGLQALTIVLTPTARAAIDGHVRLLLAWNPAINLTAIREPGAIAIRHVIDSLTGLAVLRRRQVDRFVDLGSGGGFPGLTIAAAMPADRALLIDSIGKKVRFLTVAVAAVGLEDHVAAETARSESLAASHRDRDRWPAVTARAVAPLGELIELAFPLLRSGGVLVAWKQGEIADRAGLGGELAAARRALDAIDPDGRIDVMPAVTDDAVQARGLRELARHRIVVVERGASPIAMTWPRDPATRHRQPW